MMTTQREIRSAFWAEHPTISRRLARAGSQRGSGRLYQRPTQNDYPVDTRVAFCDFVEVLARAGEITEQLAGRTTL